jgi:hypothetical protein
LLALVTALACEGATIALSVTGRPNAAMGLSVVVVGSGIWDDPACAWSVRAEAGASSI